MQIIKKSVRTESNFLVSYPKLKKMSNNYEERLEELFVKDVKGYDEKSYRSKEF